MRPKDHRLWIHLGVIFTLAFSFYPLLSVVYESDAQRLVRYAVGAIGAGYFLWYLVTVDSMAFRVAWVCALIVVPMAYYVSGGNSIIASLLSAALLSLFPVLLWWFDAPGPQGIHLD